MEEKEIKKLLTAGKNAVLIFLVIAVISAVLGAFLVYKDITEVPSETKEYSEIVATEEDVEKTYVKLDVINYMEFAEKDGETDKFCFVQDEEGYYYIAKLSAKTRKAIEDEYEIEKDDFTYELKGYLFSLPTEVKDLAIESLNDLFEEYAEESDKDFTKVSSYNLYRYVGYNYLDDTETPNSNMYVGGAVLLFVVAGVFGILTIVYLVQGSSAKKTIKKYGEENLRDELADNSVSDYRKHQIYLTKHYVFSKIQGLKIFEYEDIAWVYVLHQKTNGITTGMFLIARTKNGKTYTIASSTVKNSEDLNLIMTEIAERNKNILVGFTPDNNKAYRDIVKENKNK